jgi:hypothetical protein
MRARELFIAGSCLLTGCSSGRGGGAGSTGGGPSPSPELVFQTSSCTSGEVGLVDLMVDDTNIYAYCVGEQRLFRFAKVATPAPSDGIYTDPSDKSRAVTIFDSTSEPSSGQGLTGASLSAGAVFWTWPTVSSVDAWDLLPNDLAPNPLVGGAHCGGACSPLVTADGVFVATGGSEVVFQPPRGAVHGMGQPGPVNIQLTDPAVTGARSFQGAVLVAGIPYFLLGPSPYSLFSVDGKGGKATLVATIKTPIDAPTLVSAGGSLYVVDTRHQSDDTMVFWKVDTSGGKLSQVATVPAPFAFGKAIGSNLDGNPLLVADGTTVYWTDPGQASASGVIYMLDLASPSAPPVAVVSQRTIPYSVAIDDTYIYWTEHDAAVGDPSLAGKVDVIYRMAKPTPTCSGSACACPPQNMCGGTCVQIQSDPGNCGACGNACPTGAACSNGTCQCPSGQTSCNGACIDTTTDTANCGGCGVKCTQTCEVAHCRVQLASMPTTTSANALAVDSQYAFGIAGSTILRVPLNGGSTQVVANGQAAPFSLAIDAANVYWNNLGVAGGGAIVKAPKTGGNGSTTVLATSAQTLSIATIAVDATKVYWYDAGSIMSVPITGGSPSVVASATTSWIAVSASNLYWLTITDVMKIPLAGGSATSIWSGKKVLSSLTSDGSNLYWFSAIGTIPALNTIPLAGGTPSTFMLSNSVSNGLASDGTNVYWADTQGRVMRMPVAGGTPTPLTVALGATNSIVVDATSVYVLTQGGQLMKVTPK